MTLADMAQLREHLRDMGWNVAVIDSSRYMNYFMISGPTSQMVGEASAYLILLGYVHDSGKPRGVMEATHRTYFKHKD